GLAATVSYMYAYSAYLFFDFAGYTAFAIGVSYLFGIHTPENFDRPFLARNIREFWNRWNITLSAWLRDHIYMRFVMAATRGRWFRSRAVTSALGLCLAFGLMGLWHGTSANYLLYGLYHGTLLSAHEAFTRWNARRRWWGDGPLWQGASVLVTVQVVCFGFLLFSGRLTGNATAAPPGEHAFDGAFERATCEEIGGWAWDARDPAAPLQVEVVVDGRAVATATANLFRPDLAAAGRGDGAHAFVVVPPDVLRDGWAHETRVRIAGSAVELAGGPRQLVCGRRVENLDGRAGTLDPVTCAAVGGSAWDTTRPEAVVNVDVYDGATLLATVAADQPPAEPGGPRRFVCLTPASLRDGRAPRSARASPAATSPCAARRRCWRAAAPRPRRDRHRPRPPPRRPPPAAHRRTSTTATAPSAVATTG
ncbi:MAG: MBOAT family O-acyltransferase, partial [Candidatus Binatia bacterium]